MNLKEFKEDFDSWLQNLQRSIINESWLLHLFHKYEDRRSYKFDFLLYGYVVAIPIAKLVLVGKFLIEEVDELKVKNPSTRIQREVDYLGFQVAEITENFVMHLDKQIKHLENIEMLNLSPTSEALVSELSHTIDELFIGDFLDRSRTA